MRVVLVPGFTQTPQSWSGVQAALPPAIETVALANPVGLGFAATAAALATAGGTGIWCGYSMGARLALRLALDHPECVRGLVLVSGTAGLELPAGRVDRRERDAELAHSIEHDGVDTFLRRWLAQPMFAGVRDDAPGVADRATWRPEELATMLRDLGTGTMEPLWDRLAEITVPTAIVSGTRDAKFDAIAARLHQAIPDSTHHRIDCGHAVPLEAPAELAAVIQDFHNAIETASAKTT